VDRCQWQDVAPGLQISELRYQLSIPDQRDR
jgi:hypothetical protein